MLRPSLFARTAGLVAASVLIAGIGLMVSFSAASGSLPLAPVPMDITHNPPLLALAGEDTTLTYQVACAGVTETDCDVEGTVHVLTEPRAAEVSEPLTLRAEGETREYVADLPGYLLEPGSIVRYWATFQDNSGAGPVSVPAGGQAAASTVWALPDTTVEDLPSTFDAPRSPEATIVSGRWGSGPDEFGLDLGNQSSTVGPSAFAFSPGGDLVVLDEINQRVVRIDSTGSRTTTPLPILPVRSDLAIDTAGNYDVLQETSSQSGPRLMMFAQDGTNLGVADLPERTADQVESGPAGPLVHSLPSDEWLSITGATGSILTAQAEAATGTSGRLLPNGDMFVVKAAPEEVRIAQFTADSFPTTNLELRSQLPVGEVQLAKPLGSGILVVLRQYDDVNAQFRVLVFDELGDVTTDFVVPPQEWAETSPLSRFELGPDGFLYQAVSDAEGFAIVRYDLGATA